MAKFNVKTAELVHDLKNRVAELQARKDSYWVDKTNYEQLKQELLEKSAYKVSPSYVTDFIITGDKVIVKAEILLVDLNLTEAPPYPKEVSDYEIKQAQRTLSLYKMVSDETISLSDSELRTILGL